ncbi:MAG: tetratricopeptide repeat protein [Pseudomonadota bacterium]
MNRFLSTVFVLVTSLALGACQSLPLPSAEPVAAEAAETAPVAPAPEPEPIVYGNFTTEQLNRAILNELGGQRGHLPEAAQDYYAMAMETEDLGVIRRASQFASALGDTDAMTELGRLWIEKEPDSVEPHVVLSYQLLENGNIDEALVHMRRVLELDGEIDFTTIATRTADISVPERARIINALQALRLNYPEHRSLHYSLIQLLEQSQLSEAAATELAAYRETYGDSARLVLIEAQLELQQSRVDAALTILKAGIETYPDNRLMRFNYARLLVQVQDLQNARTQFATLAEMAPEDNETLYSLALLELELESIPRAKELFTRLLNVNYRPNDSHFYLGYISEAEGNVREAVAHYQQVHIESNNFLNAQRQTIRLLVQEGSFDAAHEWAVSVSEGNPQLQTLLTTVEADALLAAGLTDAADSLLTEAITALPENTDLLFARVLVSERLDNPVRVEEDLRSIIALDPNDARALNHLGYALADRTDRYEEALSLLERAIAIDPEDPAIIDSLGWVQYKLGRYEEALANLQRAYLQFRDQEVAAHLGEVLWAMGRHREATDIWEEALEESPDSELLKRVMERFSATSSSTGASVTSGPTTGTDS